MKILAMNFLLAFITGLFALSSGRRIFSNDATQNQVCKTSGCIEAAQSISQNMDDSVSPCDNFYQFACGKYMNSSESSNANVFIQLDKRLSMQLKESLENKIDKNDCRTLHLIKSHYFTCLNDEKASMKLLLDILDQLGGWPVLVGKSWDNSTFDWKSLIYQLRGIGYKTAINSFVSFVIGNDRKDNMNYVIRLDKAETGILHDYLLKGFKNKVVQAYYQGMVTLATALGADKKYAKKEIADSVKFEIKLAKILVSEEERKDDGTSLYHRWTLSKLESESPDIAWNEYIYKLLQPAHIPESSEIVYIRKGYLKSLEKLISKTPKRILANYLLGRVIVESVMFLDTEFRETKVNLDTPPRWQQCMKHLRTNMPLVVAALYVRKNFDTDLKKESQKLVNYVHQSFKESLKKASWMDRRTKWAALNKLKSLSTYVAYPDELMDDNTVDEYFKNLKVIPNSFLDSYLSASRFAMNKTYEQLGKGFNKTSWINHGQIAIVNAMYLLHENSIIIPAGFLQKELFAIDRPNYLNYGAMGYFIGHELTHGFDNDGAQYDEEGNLADWWDDKTLEKYAKRAECLENQYNNYTIETLGIHVDGSKTLGENIADNGGIKQAYFAYEEYERRHGVEPRLPGLSFSPRQLFWLQGANFYCEKYDRNHLHFVATTDEHSIGQFRVIGAFSNMPEFARDFKCPLGSPMNPVEKCKLW